MSGRRNNRLLLGVFLILVALFIITRFTSMKRSDRTLVTHIVHIDTSQVSSILLYPVAEQGALLEFTRSGSSWRVKKDDVSAAADGRAVTSTLAALQNLTTDQLVARSPERWSEYHVDDSLGTRVIVKEGNKTTLDLMVGRFQYQPPPRNSYDPYGQNRVSGKTYVRLSGESEVYSTEGFLAMSFNQVFDRWRDQTITRLNTAQLSRIIFDYPADSGFIADKTDAGWMVAGILADSASMVAYINRVSRKSHQEFIDQVEQLAPEPDFRVSFEGENMQTQEVRAYLQTDGQLVINSSINPETWFLTKIDGLFRELYPGSEELISGNY